MLTGLISLLWNLPLLVPIAVSLAALWYWKIKSPLPDTIPPFPCKPYPYLGHTPMMKGSLASTLHQWRQSTGDMFSLCMDGQLFIVLNTFELIKEAFIKHGEFFCDRVDNFTTRYFKPSIMGLVNNSGAHWKEQRNISMAILKKFGMGKNFLADKISIEVEAYLNVLSDLKGKPTDVRLLTNASVSNVICAILIGNRFKFDDPYFTGLLKVLNDQVALLGSVRAITLFPWLRHIPGDYFKGKKILENIRQLRQFSQKFIDEVQKNNKDQVENFITAYTNEMDKKEKANLPTYLDEDSLVMVMTDLFFAGTETTSTSLLWAMLFAIRYPDAQEKVYKEILDVVGPDRLPSMQDRPHLNYTNAYIMETQRIGSIIPLSVFRLCTKTSQVGGYTIPKNTGVIPNLDAVLKDEKTWGDPLVFRPERFFDNENNLIVPEELIPFCIGRRYCMGESLAKMELFLFVSGIFQRFHIKPEDPDNLPTEHHLTGVTRCPKPFKPRLVERKDQL